MRYFFVILMLLPSWAWAAEIETSLGRVEIREVARGLEEPWSIGFLPTGDALVTLRDGALMKVARDGATTRISGVPAVQTGGQAGLFDVLVPPEFAQTGRIYLSYAAPSGRGTAVATAVLQGNQLANLTQIFVMQSPSRSTVHFGGRLVDDGDAVILTIGERGDRNLAQDPRVDNGKIVRILKDGSGYQRLSMGHRNPQGLARDAQGQLFAHEHGAKGGDEINAVISGRNYGWPVISYGVHYDGSKIGEGTTKDGMEQPIYYWDPSIAPSGLVIHSGRGWPEAQGRFFVGSLKFDKIEVLTSPPEMRQIADIQTPETGRVRDLREAPDGSIWFLSVDNGAIYTMAPVR